MKLSSRHAFALSLFAFAAAALSACAATEEESPTPPPSELTAPAAPSVSQLPLAEGDRPISAAELEEVRRAVELPATLEILTEDGESIKLENGITSAHEGSLNGVDITFTPLDAAGRPSRRNLEVVYQRSDTLPPHFYFVSAESGPPSLTSETGSGKPGDGPISTLCLGGNWTSWSAYGGYCGYRWLCSKKKWNHDAWFEYQIRSKTCWNGTHVTQTRTHYAHCGC